MSVVEFPVRTAEFSKEQAVDQRMALIIPDDLPAGVVAGTDLAGAHLLAEHHGDNVRYSPEIGWLNWDGRRFRPDTKGTEVSLRVQDIGRRLELGAAELYRKAARAADEAAQERLRKRAEALHAWARGAQSAAAIRRIMELGQTLVSIRTDALDGDPWLLNCENGTVDLRTGELRAHRRSDFITKLAPVSFDPVAECPRWADFVDQILPDPEVRGFVQRYLGYSLTGSTREQCFVIALGPGANGKSVLAETVRSLLGDYTRDCPTDTIMHTGSGRGTENDVARLRGARFATAKETEEDKRIDEARVKQLTGEDTVTARFLFREHFEFVPTFKLWLYCNHRPRIVGTDDGIWRRVMLVPFGVIIPKSRRDPELKAKLLLESPGILAWLVRGCVEWLSSGLSAPAAVTAGTAEWRSQSDEVRAFVDDCCHIATYASVKPDPLFARYTQWSQAQGNKAPLGQKLFRSRLEGLGFAQKRTGERGRYWDGIGVSAEAGGESSDGR